MRWRLGHVGIRGGGTRWLGTDRLGIRPALGMHGLR